MDCSTIISSFSVVVAVLSILLAAAITWQIIRIEYIKKSLRDFIKEEISKERLAISEEIEKIVDKSKIDREISYNMSSLLQSQFFSLYQKSKDYDSAVKSLSFSIYLFAFSNSKQSEFKELTNVGELIEQIASEKIELPLFTVDLFAKSVYHAETKGYTNDALNELKYLLYKFAKK